MGLKLFDLNIPIEKAHEFITAATEEENKARTEAIESERRAKREKAALEAEANPKSKIRKPRILKPDFFNTLLLKKKHLLNIRVFPNKSDEAFPNEILFFVLFAVESATKMRNETRNVSDFTGTFELFVKNDKNLVDSESLGKTAEMYECNGLKDADFEKMCKFAKADGCLSAEDLSNLITLTLVAF